MSRSRQKWHCPHCSQTSSRHWNLKTHIRRKHQGIGQPIGEDEWHFTPTSTTTTTMHFIPDMMSLQKDNNNYGLNSQVHPRIFSTAYHKKEEDIYKKRDLLEEILQLWRPKIKQIKELLEIRNLFSQIQYASSQQQQQPIIGSIPVGGFSLPSSIDDLTSPPPPMAFTPETDPLKDRISGYTGFVCETCLANIPLAIYHFKENGKQVEAGHFCVPERFLKMQGLVVNEKQNIINDLNRTLSEEIKKAVKV